MAHANNIYNINRTIKMNNVKGDEIIVKIRIRLRIFNLLIK